MVIIQEILTNWSKKSRGGKEATTRNSISQAFPFVIKQNFNNFCLDRRMFAEQNQFKEKDLLDGIKIEDSKITINCITVSLNNGKATVIFRDDLKKGVPIVEPCGKTAFELGLNQSGRVIYNLRTSGYDTWFYEKRIVNIANIKLDDMDGYLFKPINIKDYQKDLW